MDEEIIYLFINIYLWVYIGAVVALIVVYKELLKARRYDRLMRFKMLVDSKKH